MSSSEEQIVEATGTREHRLSIASNFLTDGYWAECSCGWASGHWRTHEAALISGRKHGASPPASVPSPPEPAEELIVEATSVARVTPKGES